MARIVSEGRKGNFQELYRRIAVGVNDTLAAKGFAFTIPVQAKNKNYAKWQAAWAINQLLANAGLSFTVPTVIGDDNVWFKKVSKALNKVATT